MEQKVLTRLTHVGIDQQGALAELREDDRQIRGEITASLATLRADDGQNLALLGAGRTSGNMSWLRIARSCSTRGLNGW